MSYFATWGVWIPGDDIDPIEVAKQGHARAQETPGTWKITNLDTKEITIVDLTNNQIIEPEGGAPRQTQ
ncbi:hypothetical protein MINTM005_12870 [Mycobacterium intracellulare]|uniref:hypothetical protein n=1 Tax=Mycobacterium intracellulare TaxID=1767 RepID=UPI0019280D56|nr:hypothetical protein [Mycobacterium intracellulare]BCO56043.1 hypothetical protein MINTM005_12870 [Mycobacterium intracellulare]